MHAFVLLIVSTLSSGKDWREIVVRDGKVEPGFVKTNETSTVRLYCGSLFFVTWIYKSYKNYRYIYLNNPRDRALVTFGFEIKNNTITLKHLKSSDSGNFHCKGTYNAIDHGTRRFIDYAVVIIFNFAPPSHVIPNILEISESDDVLLMCGSDKEVEWFGLNIKDQEKKLLNNTIFLPKLRKELSGPYICRGVSETKIFHSASLVIVEGYIHRLGLSANDLNI